jgi:hypothetical protein
MLLMQDIVISIVPGFMVMNIMLDMQYAKRSSRALLSVKIYL